MEKKNLYTEHKCVNDNIPPLPKQALKITSSKMVKEKLILIKVGGKIVEETDSLKQLLSDFSKIEGHKVLVHGGGRSATALASKLGVESKMVNGRRITDEETLKVVTMVYGGLVNKQIVAGLQMLGINALGLTGADMIYMISDKGISSTSSCFFRFLN